MKPVDLTITMNQPVAEAQAAVADKVGPRLDGFNERRGTDTVEYRPKVVWPLIVWLVRLAQGQHVTFTFVPQGQGTEVHASGRLGDSAHADVVEALNGQ